MTRFPPTLFLLKIHAYGTEYSWRVRSGLWLVRALYEVFSIIRLPAWKKRRIMDELFTPEERPEVEKLEAEALAKKMSPPELYDLVEYDLRGLRSFVALRRQEGR